MNSTFFCCLHVNLPTGVLLVLGADGLSAGAVVEVRRRGENHLERRAELVSDVVEGCAAQEQERPVVEEDLGAVLLKNVVALLRLRLEVEVVLEPGAATGLEADAKVPVLEVAFEEVLDLFGSGRSQVECGGEPGERARREHSQKCGFFNGRRRGTDF